MSFSSWFKSRSVPVKTLIALTSGGTAYYGGTQLYRTVHSANHAPPEQIYGSPSDDPRQLKPTSLWTPPSRMQMLEALRASKALPRESGDLATANYSGTSTEVGEGSNGEGYDLLVIGGGATGVGTALDAASRGLKVAVVEREDWASGTSSKSTKLVHGGVRYLQKAIMELDREQWNLVKEALHERKIFLETAPYLSHHLPIMLPIYQWWKLPYYWVGCKMYDLLAGAENMESSYYLSKGKALEHFPMLKTDNLVGALVYYDGQHNDARMNIALLLTAVHLGAVVANYTEVVKLNKRAKVDGGEEIVGARVKDVLTGKEWDVKAKGVINATGPFSDGIRKLDDPQTKDIVAPSSGVHITLPKYYAPGEMGLLDPATSDGRVIFFLPWQGNAIAGTTDAPSKVEQHPRPQEEEIQWILDEVKNYLSSDIKVRRGDVLSAWSGIRPLVRNPRAKDSQSLVRNHIIDVSPDGLLTIAGGKWTTYRAMAQETVDAAIEAYGLAERVQAPCITERIKLIGSHSWKPNLFVKLIQQYGMETEVAKHLCETYGDRAWGVCALAPPTGLRWPVHGVRLDPMYPYLESEVRYACRREYAQRATDIIARRTRLAFLNSQAALEALPRVIDIMSDELGWNKSRQKEEFQLAKDFLLSMGLPSPQAQLTLQDVRNGKAHLYPRGENSPSRALFSPEELKKLKITFDRLDLDKDGKINEKDLASALEAMNIQNITKEKVQAIIREVDSDRDGGVTLTEFLDAASGLREVQLQTAFTHVIQNFTDLKPSKTLDQKQNTGLSKNVGYTGSKVERSGGGT